MSDSILDPAIFGETGYGEDTPANAEVIARPGKKRSRQQGKTGAAAAGGDASAGPAKPMSKSQAKKLAKIAEAKAKAERRSTVMASLAKTAASAEQLAVLRKSGALGQKSSLKADLKHTLSLQRLGVDAKHDKLLVKQRRAKPATDSDASDSDGELPRSSPAKAPSTAFAVQMPSSAGSAPAAGRPEAAPLPASGAGFRVSLSDVSFAGPLAIPDVLTPQQSQGAGASIDEQRGAEAALAALRAKNAALAMAGQFAVDATWTPDQKRHAQSQPVKNTLDVEHSSSDSSSVDSGEEEPAAGPPAPRIAPVIPAMVHSKFVVKVARPHAIAKSRQALPVVSMEQEIMEAITHHDVVIIAGETGSGKTTQVPQFLYEAGYGHPDGTPGLIGVTQPRRVATTAMAERVAAELATPVGARGHVGWQVRYDASHVSDATRVKFLTDGILLREAQSDLLLSKYSAIIIDEAHERNLNTDVLLGLLSRAVPLRAELAGTAAYPNLRRLKLIIMSATLRVSDFTENTALFPAPPPVINVRARQFPVSLHFAKRTELRDYVGEAFKKVTQIHARLPAGGILVFLTGQAEIEDLCARLTTYYSKKERVKRRQAALEEAAAAESAAEDSDGSDASSHSSASSASSVSTSSGAGSEHSEQPKPPARTRTLLQREPGLQPADAYDSDSASSAASLSDADEPDIGIRKAGEGMDDVGPVSVLPLYAMLPRAAQRRVFEAPPPGHRAIVVSTNVAETSVTIPGMRYVMIAQGHAQSRRDMKLSLCRLALRPCALLEGGSCRYAE